MNAYDLPTSLTIGGVGFPIRYNWRAVIDILIACNDPELDSEGQAIAILQIMYPDWQKIPADCIEEALRKACDFIDCGQKDDGKPKPKMIDWEQDASIIIPEINKVAHKEIRMNPDIHWWTFFGWFMGIGDGLLANVLHIRQKLSQGQKLDKWERDFYLENKAMCDLERRYTAEEMKKIKDIEDWLKG